MESVGIKELKARLSEYVAQVRAGKRILITDRGTAVAELVPLDPDRQTLAHLAEEGQVSWSGGRPRGLSGVIVRGRSMAETVIEDRR